MLQDAETCQFPRYAYLLKEPTLNEHFLCSTISITCSSRQCNLLMLRHLHPVSSRIFYWVFIILSSRPSNYRLPLRPFLYETILNHLNLNLTLPGCHNYYIGPLLTASHTFVAQSGSFCAGSMGLKGHKGSKSSLCGMRYLPRCRIASSSETRAVESQSPV